MIRSWITVLVLTWTPFAFAKGLFPAEARLFAGSTTTSPADVNAELSSDGLKKISAVSQYGVEIDYPLFRFFHIGLRYTHRDQVRDDQTLIVQSNDYGEVDQDSVMAIGRIPLINSKFVRLDGFAGFGGANTSLKLETASQDGEITRRDSHGWFAAPVASYGGSLSIGYKVFYLVVELGYESNKIKGLKKSGNVTANINSIDLSGSYFTVGLQFDGASFADGF